MPFEELAVPLKKRYEAYVQREKVAVTINSTVMAEIIDEIECLVKLAKELETKISVAVAHEYCNDNASSPDADKIQKIAHWLMQMKCEGYPIVN